LGVDGRASERRRVIDNERVYVSRRKDTLMKIATNEKRYGHRTSRSGGLTWRFLGGNKSEIGLLLETSEHGMAFAWRGTFSPKVGTLIEVLDEDGDDRRKRVVVRRSSVCHDNLRVIGAELVDSGPFPSTFATQAIAQGEFEEPKMLMPVLSECGARPYSVPGNLLWAG